MNKLSIFAFSIFFTASLNSDSAIINIPNDYPTIQQGIDASLTGDTVVVMPGTYFENINLHGKNILLTSQFYLANDTAFISLTIINGSMPTHPDTSSCIIIVSGEDSTCIVQGFTITSGQGTKWLDAHGAGTYREGGGILIDFSSPIIRFNRIINNWATNSSGIGVAGAGGGGIRVSDGYPHILNNVIAFNQGKYGPGIVLNYTGCVMRNNLICYNSGGQTFNGGGAIWAIDNFGTYEKIIENNTIYGNKTTTGTGGILAWQTSSIIRNNIIRANTSPNNSQIYLIGGGMSAITYSNVQGGFAGNGNIDFNPLFIDTSNFYLQPLSPCVDAGDSSVVFNDVENPGLPGFALFPAMGTVRNDMGAYGGQGVALLGQGVTTSLYEIFLVEPEIILYPNPATGKFNVKCSLPAGQVERFKIDKIEICDAHGKMVVNKTFEKSISGFPSFNADIGKMDKGIYFVKIFFGDKLVTRKLSVQ